MKKILGLDLGTNSIGWALVSRDLTNKKGEILGMGSRIIPMSQDIIGDFGKGNSVSQTAERTKARSARRLKERHLLRRQRLHRVLNVLGFLPAHYANQIDFEKRLGHFKEESEPKLAYDTQGFIFKNSFEEMLADFKIRQPELLVKKNGEPALIPYDWTIYYLRKKALNHKIRKEELAWIILNFNQKRGYYQLRGEEEEENPNKLVEFHSLKVNDVKADEKPNAKGEIWYSIVLENGWVYRRSSKVPMDDWIGKTKDFIVTTDLTPDGSFKTDKEGNVKRSFRAPEEGDWTLIKKKTEKEIENSNKTVGEYIYEALLSDPRQKIRGKLVRTIERKFYRAELERILRRQIELQPELFTEDLYSDCVRELYRSNESHRDMLGKKDFLHLFINDIIFYQRPLRSKKSTVSNCSLEFRKYKAKNEKGLEIEVKEYLKAVPKSNPFYQEFRVWQWLFNLKIFRNSGNQDVTSEFIKNREDIARLFEFLMSRAEVDHKDLFKYFFPQEKPKGLAEKMALYRWNYVYDEEKGESKKYPMNETGAEISRRLAKLKNVPPGFLSKEVEYRLWHLIYSVTDKKEYEQALRSFARKYNIDEESFLENFLRFPPFKSEYGSFSEKAIKKLLPLMRVGKYWSWESIDQNVRKRIEKIINAEFDEEIKDKVREKAIDLSRPEDFQGLPLWLAQYIVYNRHSEAEHSEKWKSPANLENFLREFKQHSLRNPIVEQVVTEALRVVKDIWTQYGQGKENFFDEIHVELGRELKNTADERKRLTSAIAENENTNLRIKALLMELQHDPEVENVRPYSPVQQEILKIYEEGVLNSDIEIDDDILKISRKAEPTKAELQRYKLWLEQKYRSPYTGEIIPLNRLFTPDYEIEHIIPRSRYFDDSFSNKVICEAAVNKLKDNQLGLEFIKNHYGQKVPVGYGREVKIFTEAEYRDFVSRNYEKNRSKRIKLLLEDIPEKMIERQINDTRYVSKYISQVLSNIVRAEDGTDNGVNSKNLIPVTGKITGELRQDWGLNDVWNDLILPRFERMNKLTNSDAFTVYNEKYQKFLPTVPFELSKGFQKKRIDHRHHALDALVVACATRDHVNLLNNEAAKSDTKRYDLQRKLRKMEQVEYVHPKTGETVRRQVPKEFLKPWDTFTEEAREALENIVVSFKQNLRVINKATNRYEKFVEKDGVLKKVRVKQEGVNWAIRKPLHKDTIAGLVNLSWKKAAKGKILTAYRKSINSEFNLKTIDSITDTGIQKILRNYLTQEKFKVIGPKGEISYDSERAFSPEGLEDLNQNIALYNDGKPHKPIYKVRVFEEGSKFRLGHKGNKKAKYAEAAKGTNLFFAVYADEDGKRSYATIPLNEVIERQKQGLLPAPEKNEKGHHLLFTLSPNDLVYVPSLDEPNGEVINSENLLKKRTYRIYRFTDGSGTMANFIPANIAEVLFNLNKEKQKKVGLNFPIQNEIGVGSQGSKNERAITGEQIKAVCYKISVDRLGNISRD